MNNIFKLARIKLSEILDDITNYTSEVYGQSKNVYSAASAWGQVILVLSRISHMIMYYIEDSITELNIKTATRENSIKGLIQMTGHNVTRAIAAQGDVFLIPTGNIPNITGQHVIIPNFVKLASKINGLTYLLVTNQTEYKVNIFNDKNKILAKIIQGELESQSFTGTGEALQSYECNMVPGKEIDNFFVNVFVNGIRYKQYDSFYDIPRNYEGCIVRTGMTSGIDVIFGNGDFGAMPPIGAEILIEYLTTSGLDGNINSLNDSIFEFTEEGYDTEGNSVDLNDVFRIAVNTPITFGSNSEDLELSKIIAPKHSRNFVLGTLESFKTFFEKFQLFSTIKVYNDYNPNDLILDNIIYLLLIPDITKKMKTGENYFTIPQTFFSLSDFEKYKIKKMIEESRQKAFTTIIKFIDPQFKKYAVNIYVNTWKGSTKDSVYEDITTKLSEYFVKFNREDFLPKSDLISLIEQIDGVDSVNLYFVSEDIEKQINYLINATDSEISSNLYLNNSEKDDIIAYWKTTASLQLRANKLFEQTSFIDFSLKHIDEAGDIVISKDEIPIIRGGFKDRNNRFYDDVLDKNKLCSVNINFVKENLPKKK